MLHAEWDSSFRFSHAHVCRQIGFFSHLEYFLFGIREYWLAFWHYDCTSKVDRLILQQKLWNRIVIQNCNPDFSTKCTCHSAGLFVKIQTTWQVCKPWESYSRSISDTGLLMSSWKLSAVHRPSCWVTRSVLQLVWVFRRSHHYFSVSLGHIEMRQARNMLRPMMLLIILAFCTMVTCGWLLLRGSIW